jgi:hypothetical protein
VKGTVVGVSLLGTTFQVEWENDITKKTNRSWIGLSELDIMGLGEPLQANETPTWTDIRALIDDFTDVTEERWKNTRALCKQLKGEIDDKSVVARSLSLLTLPSIKTVGPNEYASQAVCQILDSQFVLAIRTRYTALDSREMEDKLTPKDHDIIFRHLVNICRLSYLSPVVVFWRSIFCHLLSASQICVMETSVNIASLPFMILGAAPWVQ